MSACPLGFPGCSRGSAQKIFDINDFLQQVHVSSAADELQKTIVVLQPTGSGAQSMVTSGGSRLAANAYAPGYAAPCEDLNKAEVESLLQRGCARALS